MFRFNAYLAATVSTLTVSTVTVDTVESTVTEVASVDLGSLEHDAKITIEAATKAKNTFFML